MHILGIFLVVVVAPFSINVNSSPVEMELEAKANSSSQEVQTETSIAMTTETATASAINFTIVEEIEIQTTNNPEIENEIATLTRGKCSGNGNRNQTQIKSGNVKLIPFPLCKPIQGLFHTSLCAIVCGLPLKSDENTCRFSNEDKAVFCDCGGAEEGETAACGSGLERQTLCHHPTLSSSAKVCRNICGKLGKSYDFCMSPGHARRAFCTCFDASRTQNRRNRREIEDASEKIQEQIPTPTPAQTPSSTTTFTSAQAVKKQETIEDDDDVDVDDAEEESCDDDKEDENSNGTVTGNGTAIGNLRQQNVGACHTVLSAYKMEICTGICGRGAKTCRVNKAFKTVYCDCPGNEVGRTAFCGPNAELYKHCFVTSPFSKKRDCQSICSDIGKRGEICLSPQNSLYLTMCSCFSE